VVKNKGGVVRRITFKGSQKTYIVYHPETDKEIADYKKECGRVERTIDFVEAMNVVIIVSLVLVFSLLFLRLANDGNPLIGEHKNNTKSYAKFCPSIS